MRAAPEQCVILVGGLGTRLGDAAKGAPKPLVDVGGKPFLSYLLLQAARHGFKRALLLAGHRADQVIAQAPLLCPPGLELEVMIEPEPLGTGGALRMAADRMDERVLLLNGDSLFDFNWLDLLGSDDPAVEVVVALRQAPDASRFGVAMLEEGRITRFEERGDAKGGLINGGVYLLTRDAARACADRGSFERDALPRMAARGRLRGRVEEGFFVDIGVPDALAQAQASVPASLRRPAVFFDRDGVLNQDAGYTHRVVDLVWMEGAISAVKAVNDAGWFAFLVTNQAGVARGLYAEDDVQAFHAQMQADLRASGAHLDAIEYCPHHPMGSVSRYAVSCDCRKPAPGMLCNLLKTWPVDAERSILIGDKPSDLMAASSAGVRGVAFEGGDLSALVHSELRR